MKIVTLVENSCHDSRLKEEFGLSLLIEGGGARILFDMGATSLFAENGDVLGAGLIDIDCAVVSHAHYDHGGGLATFLERNTRASVYVGKNAAGDYYGNAGAKLPLFLEPMLHPLIGTSRWCSRYVGLDKSVLDEKAARFVEAEDMAEICENVFLLTEIQQDYPLAEGNKYLLELDGQALRRDRFSHELIMVVREPDGLGLVTGCGHGGILNMLKTVQYRFAGERIKTVVGGFHLAMQPGKPGIAGNRDDIIFIADELHKAGVDKVLTGHCTGEEACSILAERLGERFERLSTGSSHTV